MSYIPNENYVDIARGRVPGSQPFSGFGKRVTAGAETNVLWPNGAYAFPPPAGVQMSLVSTSASDGVAGTGIRSVEMHYLDANLAERSEVVTLNGTTPVLTVATNIRFIQCLHINTFGSGKAAAGNITVSNGGVTYAYIAMGDVRCSSSVRMVPAGKRLIVESFFGGSVSGSAAASTIVYMSTPNFAGHDYIADAVFIPLASGAFQDNSAGLAVKCPLVFTAGQAVGMTFVTDKAATIVGTWFGWLENV